MQQHLRLISNSPTCRQQQLCCYSPSPWQPTPKLHTRLLLIRHGTKILAQIPSSWAKNCLSKNHSPDCSCYWSDFQTATIHHKMKSCRTDSRLQPRQVQLHQPHRMQYLGAGLACLYGRNPHTLGRHRHFPYDLHNILQGLRMQTSGSISKKWKEKQISTCACTLQQ